MSVVRSARGDCVLKLLLLCVVVLSCSRLFAVAELILRCKTTYGVVERRVQHVAKGVSVSRRFTRRSALTHPLQLWGMGLTEVPSELFRKKNLKRVDLSVNNLCSLPSEIAQLAALETLQVRLSK